MATRRAPPQVEALCVALERASAQVAAVMRQVTDPSGRAVGTWSIGEVAAHVSGSADYFLGAARGVAVLERLDEVDAVNARSLAEDPERDPRILADRLEQGERSLVAFARSLDGDRTVQPFEGVEVPMSTTLGIELGELLVHGFDMARAAGLEWRIDPGAALITLQAYLPLFPYTLDTGRARGVRLALDMRIRGMAPVVVSIVEGRLAILDPGAAPVDAHLSAAPVAYLLLMWNRIPMWVPVLRSQLLVWGRRPWRAAELGALMLT